MSNLAQYRFSIILFSVGLLFVVSEVVGDGDKPGALDVATKSVAHRLNSGGANDAAEGGASDELAVTETVEDPSSPSAGSPRAGPWAAVTNAVSPRPEPEADEDDEAAPGPDASMIHK